MLQLPTHANIKRCANICKHHSDFRSACSIVLHNNHAFAEKKRKKSPKPGKRKVKLNNAII